MPNDNLKKLYVDELKDLFSAENQLLKALPKMAKAASSDELRAGFEEHLEQTKGHVQRLENIFQSLDESPKGKKCVGMEGLVKEGAEVMAEDLEGAVVDAGLIGAAHAWNTMRLPRTGGQRVSQSSRRDESRFFAETDS
jgi:ferritin-like metal-binding protein YciE